MLGVTCRRLHEQRSPASRCSVRGPSPPGGSRRRARCGRSGSLGDRSDDRRSDRARARLVDCRRGPFAADAPIRPPSPIRFRWCRRTGCALRPPRPLGAWSGEPWASPRESRHQPIPRSRRRRARPRAVGDHHPSRARFEAAMAESDVCRPLRRRQPQAFSPSAPAAVDELERPDSTLGPHARQASTVGGADETASCDLQAPDVSEAQTHTR